MYYCAAHAIAYGSSRQFQGHWLHNHQGEPRPNSDEAFVEQVPEGAKIAPPPRGSRTRTPPTPDPGSADPARGTTPENPALLESFSSGEMDDGNLLDQLLLGIGVPQTQRQSIVTGYRIYATIRDNPYNLFTFINSRVSPNLRAQVPLVVQEMFPGGEQDSPDMPYLYRRPRQDGPGPMLWQGQGRWSGSQPWAGPPDVYYDPRYSRPMLPVGQNGEANPQVVALQKQVDAILGEFQAERAERAREKQERDLKDRDAAWQAQLNALAAKVDGTYKDLGDLVKGLGDQLQKGHSEVEGSRTQELAQKVTALTEIIASQKDAALLTSVEALHKELATVQQKVNSEPTGKTTEDLLSQGIPLALEKIDGLGNTIRGELQGIRAQAAAGQLPGIALPTAPTSGKPPGAASPVETAQQIAGARQLEDEILAQVGTPAGR